MKLPISVMVVGCNESHILRQCLESVSFCNEIIYTDLNSFDDSLMIAEKFATKIFHRERKFFPSGEYVQAEIVNYTSNDWIIFIDPDERIDDTLAQEIKDIFPSLQASNSIGAVLVPWVFYLGKKKLVGTAWGGNNKKFLLVNKGKFDFLPITHLGRRLKDGYNYVEIKQTSGNVLHHYWMNNYRTFLEKHQRYLKKEGRDHYNAGFRISKKQFFLTPIKEFHYSFFSCKGYKDGVTGFLLSLFWTYYKTRSATDLLLIQRRKRAIRQRKIIV